MHGEGGGLAAHHRRADYEALVEDRPDRHGVRTVRGVVQEEGDLARLCGQIRRLVMRWGAREFHLDSASGRDRRRHIGRGKTG